MANIVPVHKKGHKASVENYRPISLTCLLMKVFERIISDELLAKCHDKLNGGQHGFLPHRSCTTKMLNFNDTVKHLIPTHIMAVSHNSRHHPISGIFGPGHQNNRQLICAFNSRRI